mmetsp:Transcript_22671/g.27774  ORF Transcript_22671/g.27774 Transcript_22671/m.27774 type:complete len:185 (-) Transcript_22671:725-1279(-)
MDLILKEVGKFKKEKLKATETKVSTLSFVVDLAPDEELAQIRDNLFVGSASGAGNIKEIEKYEITHVLNLAGGYIGDAFPEKLTYLTIDMLDLPDFDLLKCLDDCISFIAKATEGKNRCLVHCNAGVSRSTSAVIAYLMSTEALSYDQAYSQVKEKRQATRPNDGFTEQLKLFEQKLNHSESSK